MSRSFEGSFKGFASVIAVTVAVFGTSTAYADDEAPKAEAKAEAPKAESPKTESPKTESPKTTKKDPPKAEAPKAKDAPKDKVDKADKAEAPKAEAPKADAPKAEPAKADAPDAKEKSEKGAEPALPVRPNKPLTLAPQNESTPWGYKLFAFVVIAAGIVFWMKRRKKIDSTAKKPARLEIVARSSVGVRSELIVVEVEGTRLLVGMTPSAIQTLAVLDSGDPMMAAEERERATEPAPEPAAFVASTVTDRVKTLLGTKPTASNRPSVEPPTQRMPQKRATVTRISARPTTMRTPVATQAKGLLLALEEDRAIER